MRKDTPAFTLFKYAATALCMLLSGGVSFSQSFHGHSDSSRIIIEDSTLTVDDDSSLHRVKSEYALKSIGDSAAIMEYLTEVFSVDSVALKLPNPSLSGAFKIRFDSKQPISVLGGMVSCQSDYHSNIDTPYLEKNILQHAVTGSFSFVAGRLIPFEANYWVLRSNSDIFRDITEVRLSFDPARLKATIASRIRQNLSSLYGTVDDRFTEKNLAFKSEKLSAATAWLKDPFQLQKLVEVNEILHVPSITFDPSLPAEKNRQREDSLRAVARRFLNLYKKITVQRAVLEHQVDSLQTAVKKIRQRKEEFKSLSANGWKDYASYKRWKDRSEEYGMHRLHVPRLYEWLLGVRNFSVGRSVPDYSDLTLKNTGVNGINFEYNSWYYLALSAGSINFRFRDYTVNANRLHQYIYLVRAGIGRLESTHLIASAFNGKKQIYSTEYSNTLSPVYDIKGYSFEGRLQLFPGTYITGEVAGSSSPDFRTSPAETKAAFSFSDKTNKAYALRLSSYSRKWHGNIEGFYKYTGSNYQSFASYQTNAVQTSWYIRGQKSFFDQAVRLSASLRSNDFSNPYLIQQYSSNAIMKNFTLSFQKRKWPTVTLGYIPSSQLTKIGDQLVENRFQSINATLYHSYKITGLRSSSTVIYNKFLNRMSDSSFVYSNATNILLSQNIFFNSLTAGLGISETGNSIFKLLVFDENVRFRVGQKMTATMGVKINNYNNDEVRVGGYAGGGIPIGKQDMLYANYERGYLPGGLAGLVRNDMASIQYTKIFSFK